MEDEDASTAMDGNGERTKRRWSDFSPGQQTAIVVGGIVELVITTIAVRDLARRPASGVRGWKLPWLLACVVQPVGPILYLLIGRRPTDGFRG